MAVGFGFVAGFGLNGGGFGSTMGFGFDGGGFGLWWIVL